MAVVKVTKEPAQTGLADGAIDRLTGRFGFTVMAMAFELAGFPVAQVALDVKTQVMESPFTGV